MEQEWSWVLWIVVILAAIVVVRGTVRFDVNEWLRDRRKQKEENLKALCPHVRPDHVDGELGLRSTFLSPAGTLIWQCQQCGVTTHDQGWIDHNTRYWINHPDELTKRFRKITKLSESLGLF